MIFSVAYLSLFFFLYLFLLLVFLLNQPLYAPARSLPSVSVLLAVRNEEKNIRGCLAALETLDYPPDKIEVLVGDDSSTDGTWNVLTNYTATGFAYRCIRITENLGQARGKGNVLAHLAHLATSDYFLITDADIHVPPSWVGAMMGQLSPGTGIVTGITTIGGDRLFGRLQAVDWLYSLGLMQAVRELGLPVSTMGNNMLITREAYFAAGGFENIPFSVTEDVRLFEKVRQKGFRTVNVYDPQVLAWSLPTPDLGTLLHQRKRWMKGSMHLPWYMVLVLVVHAAYYPVVLPFFLHVGFWPAAGVFVGKLVLQTIYIQRCFQRLGLSVSWPLLVLFEFYQLALTLVLLIFYFLPIRVNWKGRRY